MQDQSGLVAGTYDLHVTDNIGCTLDTFFILRQPNPIDILPDVPNYNGVEIACADSSTGQITVLPYGGADSTRNTYTWDMPDGSEFEGDSVLSDLSAGFYSLTITDINGCEFTWAFILNQPDPIEIRQD